MLLALTFAERCSMRASAWRSRSESMYQLRDSDTTARDLASTLYLTLLNFTWLRASGSDG